MLILEVTKYETDINSQLVLPCLCLFWQQVIYYLEAQNETNCAENDGILF